MPQKLCEGFIRHRPPDPTLEYTVGTKIIADPDKCFQELISKKLLILLWNGPCLELIVVFSNFQAFLLLHDKLLESVCKRLIPVKGS